MTASASVLRESAGKVAQWLVEKGRPDDAVALLAAWAVAGPNDSEGQQLLAEALRLRHEVLGPRHPDTLLVQLAWATSQRSGGTRRRSSSWRQWNRNC